MTTLPDWAARLEGFLKEKMRSSVHIRQLRQLTGGASRDTWALDVEVIPAEGASPAHPTDLQRLVLRRDMGGEISTDALSREQEFRVLQAARAGGVLAPTPRWLCTDPAVLGVPFFLMDRLEGESVGRRVVREATLAEARKVLPRQMAEQLALIHAIDPHQAGLDFLPRPAPGQSPAQRAVEQMARQLWQLGEPHPVLELAIRWLLQHAPECPALVLVHGDFRVGNLMVNQAGLAGVFDWEFTRVGDPLDDLAWPCVRSWRFGQDALPLGGVAGLDEYLEVYERLSGRKVSRAGLRYWEVLGNLRWAVGCISQANRHLSGQAPNVELASLGRRAAEMELELLDLLELADVPEGGKP
jgi:aminoglycoside phosphotransferase (APT) family kinase protein